MSYGQLFPNGTVPSAGIATRVGLRPRLRLLDAAARRARARDTSFKDSGHRRLPGAHPRRLVPAAGRHRVLRRGQVRPGARRLGRRRRAAASTIDSACGPTGKAVYDAAQIADPEIDYSDYDTDKDGVVDFFMMVFAGCGGNGASQLTSVAARTTTSGRTRRASSSTSPIRRPGSRATSPTTSSRTSRAGRSTTPTPRAPTMTTDGDAVPGLRARRPYNVNPESAVEHASVISHEYGHSLGLPDFYSTGSRATYGDWNLMATDKSQNMDVIAQAGARLDRPARPRPEPRRSTAGPTPSRTPHRIDWQTRTERRTCSQGAGVNNARRTSPSCPAGRSSTRRR